MVCGLYPSINRHPRHTELESLHRFGLLFYIRHQNTGSVTLPVIRDFLGVLISTLTFARHFFMLWVLGIYIDASGQFFIVELQLF